MALYQRLRALACREWKLAPHELDALASQGRILFEDVAELVTMMCHDPLVALWISDYLWPEQVKAKVEEEKRVKEEAAAAKRKREWEINFIRMINMCKPKDEAEKKQMQQIKETLSRD